MNSTSQNKPQTDKKLRSALVKAGSAVFWIGIWFLAAELIGRELILPTPFRVLQRLGQLLLTGDFWSKTGMTLLRIVAGFLLGTVLGIVFAVLSALSEPAQAVISPLIRILRATPVASFIILVMLWVGYSFVPIVISAMIVMPVLYLNVYHGIEATDAALLEYAKAYRLSRFKTVTDIYIPSIRPFFVSAAVTSMGLAWKSGVAAEVLARPVKAIGSEIYFSKIYIETADLFAWTVVVIVLSLILEKVITYIISRKDRIPTGASSKKSRSSDNGSVLPSAVSSDLTTYYDKPRFKETAFNAPAIEVKDLTVSFDGNAVLNRLNLTFDQRITCLMGESGRGKTTLLRALSGLCPISGGSFANKPSRPAVLFQEDRLLPWFTVERNLNSDPIALYYLERLGLADTLNKYPQELSGGMSRRVALARVLAYAVNFGDILLLDEPFNGLDEDLVRTVAEILRELPLRIIITTHDVRDAELLNAAIIRI